MLLIMSTRYIKKENTVILGLEKNGSQAVKRTSWNNPKWVNTESNVPQDIFLNEKITIYIPIRDEFDRAISGLLEDLNGEIKENKIENIQAFVKDRICLNNKHTSIYTYKHKHEIRFFFEKIFLNKNWKGCKVKFFDLKYFSTTFCDFIQEERNTVPITNTLSENKIKEELVKYLPSKEVLLKFFFTSEWRITYEHLERPIWDRMRDTEYWLHLK